MSGLSIAAAVETVAGRGDGTMGKDSPGLTALGWYLSRSCSNPFDPNSTTCSESWTTQTIAIVKEDHDENR